MLRHVQLGDWSWVLVPLLGARRMDVRLVESHLLETVVAGIGDVGTVGDDARKSCVNWGLLLYERSPSVSSRPFRGWSSGVSCTSSGCSLPGCCWALACCCCPTPGCGCSSSAIAGRSSAERSSVGWLWLGHWDPSLDLLQVP